MMNSLWQDIKFGIRMLVKNPGFTLIAVLSLALGIGASTAVFSLVNAVLLSSLSVPNPHELRVINWSGKGARFHVSGAVHEEAPGMFTGNSVSFPIYNSLRKQCQNKADLFAYADLRELTILTQNQSFTANGLMVSDNFFSGLGIKPLFGSVFEPGNDSVDDAFHIVISYSLWERHFGLDPHVLGQTVTLKRKSFTITGVLPQGVKGIHPGDNRDIYISMESQPHVSPGMQRTSTDHWWVHLMARVQTGVRDNQFQAAIDLAFANASEGQLTQPRMIVQPGKAGPANYASYYKKHLFLLFGIVCIVVCVACTNLAGLSIARSAVRQQEYSLRAAIGAGRWQLIRQTLTESFLLSFMGGGFGILFAFWGKEIISRLMTGTPGGLRYDTSLDYKVLLFTFSLTILTALFTGLLPAFRAANADPNRRLKSHSIVGMLRMRTGRALVAVQIALTLILITGAGLYLRTLINLTHINPGFNMEHNLLIQVNPRQSGYGGKESTDYFLHAQERLVTIPGVQSVAATQFAMLSGWMSGGRFFSLPYNSVDESVVLDAHRLRISETYFKTMQIPIRIGREFTAADTKDAQKVVIVNETFVREYLSDVYPVGQSMRIGETDWKIVGVCADTKYTDIKKETPPTVYFSCRQKQLMDGYFVVRSALPAAAMMKASRNALTSFDSKVPIISMRTQQQVRDEQISQEWMFACMCGSLALIAVLLCCIGLYSLMAFYVACRTNEIGVRKALGATNKNIIFPILYDAIWMTVAGIIVGVFAALVMSRIIQSQLYGVEPHDPFSIGIAIVLILSLMLVAAWLPARRAANVDPMTALRCE